MEKYEAPEMEIICFENEDVITSSCPTDATCVDCNNNYVSG